MDSLYTALVMQDMMKVDIPKSYNNYLISHSISLILHPFGTKGNDYIFHLFNSIISFRNQWKIKTLSLSQRTLIPLSANERFYFLGSVTVTIITYRCFLILFSTYVCRFNPALSIFYTTCLFNLNNYIKYSLLLKFFIKNIIF